MDIKLLEGLKSDVQLHNDKQIIFNIIILKILFIIYFKIFFKNINFFIKK